MPELPEVESVRVTLSPFLEHNTITGFDLYWSNTVATPPPAVFEANVVGKRINQVCRRGKFIVFTLSSGDYITVHLRMTGELRYFLSNETLGQSTETKYLRALFHLEKESSLAFFDIRKFGRIQLLKPDDWDKFHSRLGIEPLSSLFTEREFLRILQRYRRQVKALLLDQRVIAGLGNIYVDEALFSANVHPKAISNGISSCQARRLHGAIVEILQLAITNRGTTFSNYRNGLGEVGNNQSMLRIYGRKPGSPCQRCGSLLLRTIVAQRGTIFCPVCQQDPIDSTDALQ